MDKRGAVWESRRALQMLACAKQLVNIFAASWHDAHIEQSLENAF
jgi:hypothetical protein